MKRMFSFLLLFIFCIARAQTGEKISYYYKGRKISFPLNHSRVIIKLRQGEAFGGRRAALSVFLHVPDTSIKQMGNSRLIAARLPQRFSRARVKLLEGSLRQKGYADFVHPCFTSASGKDMGYGDTLVVKLKPAVAINRFNSLLQQYHCSLVKKYPFADNIYLLSAGPANGYDAVAMANRLYETGLFEYAEPDCTLLDGLFIADPNDPLYSYQWSHKNTGSPSQYNGTPGADMSVQQAWGISTGAGITVAVIDEGVDTGHADLKANLLQGYDCLSGTANYGDGRPLGLARAHGTNCAGIIAAVANNNIGIAGVSPDSKIIPINIAAANGMFTSESNIASGFDYAWQHGADIISNSWGGGTPSNIIDDAIDRAILFGRGGKGTVVLFASGNNNSGISYPSSLPEVISVGGVNMCGQRKFPGSCDGENWGASYGVGLDVVAPCVKIVSTDISGSGGYNKAPGAAGDYFFTFNGTSSATPAAAGVAALILSANNNLTATQLRAVLESTCDKLPGYSYSMVAGQPNGSWNNETGHGRVNAFNAVQAAISGSYCNVEIRANGPRRFCSGGNVLLTVLNPVAGTSYQWRKDGLAYDTGQSLIARSTGSYDVLATGLNGCTAVSAPVRVEALDNTTPLLAMAGRDTFICAGNAVKLGGNPVATGGAPALSDKRAYGMDWMSNSFIRFSLDDPLHYDTIARQVVNAPEFLAGQFFSGGDFTPYGYLAIAKGSNKLIKVDTATGARQLIGLSPAPAGYYWSGLAWDPEKKNLYGLATASSGSRLCLIDPFTAAVTSVAAIPVGLMEWIAINSNGNMYALSDNGYIYRLNKFTGAANPLPYPVGANTMYDQDADFDPVTGILYMTTLIKAQGFASDLRTVDTLTGISHVIGSLGGLSEIDATAIAGPGYQYNWSPAAGLSSTTVSVPLAKPVGTTVYTLKVTDMCGNTATSQVTIRVAGVPPVAISASRDSICVGETVALHATADSAYAYQWYHDGNPVPGATDSIYIAGTGGVYRVRAIRSSCDSLSQPFTIKACESRLNNSNPLQICNTYFYDSGGPAANYGNNEWYIKTISAATPGSMPRLTLQSFKTEFRNDLLTVYDGPDTLAPVLADLSGTPAVPRVYTAAKGTLTLRFKSNATITDSGWAGTLTCYQPRVYRSRLSGNAAEAGTWEVKSGNAFVPATDIPQVYDDSIMIQTGHTVTISTPMQLDQLWVMPSATLQVNAALVLNDGPGPDLLADGTLIIGASGNISGKGMLALNGSLDNTASVNSRVGVRMEITGHAPQSIAAGGSFAAIYISNPAVTFSMANELAVDALTLNNGHGSCRVTAPGTSLLTINTTLSLQGGRLAMGNNTILNLSPACAVDGGNDSAFVEGPVRCNTFMASASLFFPIGQEVYRPARLQVTHASSGPSAYQAQLVNAAAPARSLPASLNGVSSLWYVRISNMGSQPLTAAAATLSYGWDDGVTDAAFLRIARSDGGGSWLDMGGAGTGNGKGTISSSVSFSSFGDFALANAINGNNALPVNWLQVTASASGRLVQVNWTSSNELNVTGYGVERSANGIVFTDMAMINTGFGTTAGRQYQVSDGMPLQGNNYYRIRQIGKDGRYSYSKTVMVNMTAAGMVTLWPNPASASVTVQLGQPIQHLYCYNSNGQLIFEAKPATNQYTIPLQHWAAGVYQLAITTGRQVVHTRFVKK